MWTVGCRRTKRVWSASLGARDCTSSYVHGFLNFFELQFWLIWLDYFKLRFLRMADVNVTLRYMYGLVKKNFTSQFTDVNSYFVTQTPIGLRRTARFVTFVHRRKIKSPDRVLRVMQIIKRARMERKSAHQVPRLMQVTRAWEWSHRPGRGGGLDISLRPGPSYPDPV